MPVQRGFTLIELLVTITVLGILLGVGVPALRDLTANNRMVALTNEIVSGLQYARSEAITRNADVWICAVADAEVAAPACSGTDWSTGWKVFTQVGGAEVILRTNEGSSGLQAIGVNSIDFGGDGRASGQVDIRLCDSRGKEYGREINIDMTGRPRVRKLAEECS